MVRRRKTALSILREPNGRPSRANPERELAPAQIKRLRDAALAGLQHEEWGSELGRLWLAGKIEAVLYMAGRRWSECVADYHAALSAPPPNPIAVPLERSSRAAAVDANSERGRALAKRERAAIRQFREAHAVLRSAGGLAERVVRSVCEQDQAPGGVHELQALEEGLRCLARSWHMVGK
jgi:hypothetical protein